MFKVTFNGLTWKQFWNKKRREDFVRNEVRPGRVIVCWQDVDHMVYGWDLSCDNEVGLLKVAALISEVKYKKLFETVNAKGESNGKERAGKGIE